LSERDGWQRLIISSLPSCHSTEGSIHEVCKITVKAKKLDTLTEELALKRCDLVKIDVTGAEQKVLNGALNTIKNFKSRLLIEVHSRALFISICHFLYALGYKIKVINEMNKGNLLHVYAFYKET